MSNEIKHENFIFSLRVRINYADQAANNILASKVGNNSGSLWSNIATVNYPSGLAGPAGTQWIIPLINYHILIHVLVFVSTSPDLFLILAAIDVISCFAFRVRFSHPLWLLRRLLLLKLCRCLLRPGQGPWTARMHTEYLNSLLCLHTGNQTCTHTR